MSANRVFAWLRIAQTKCSRIPGKALYLVKYKWRQPGFPQVPVEFKGFAMSSEQNKQRPLFKSPLVTVVVSALLAGSVIFGLVGCNPKPHGKPFGQNGLPKDAVTIFFSKYQGNQSIVEDVIRTLPKDAQSDPLPFAVTELLKGPTPQEKNEGFYSEIPRGTKLLSLKTSNDTVNINLSSQFEIGGGSNSMEQRFKELKQTVYSVDSQHKINLSVEGKPLELLGGEGLEVQDSLKREQQ